MTHTAARKQAAAAGTRVATMPGVTDDMFSNGAITADYGQVKALTEQVASLLSAGSRVRVEKEGLVLSFSIDGRDGILSTGLYLNPGESGNLPPVKLILRRWKAQLPARLRWTDRLQGSVPWTARWC